jgi:hypothetical protein
MTSTIKVDLEDQGADPSQPVRQGRLRLLTSVAFPRRSLPQPSGLWIANDLVAGDQRPPVQYGRYKFVGDRLWLGVNAYWGFGGDVTTSDGAQIPKSGSCKRFGYWESLNQATKEETWIVYKPVTKAEWNAAGYGGCDACATFPPAEVCE